MVLQFSTWSSCGLLCPICCRSACSIVELPATKLETVGPGEGTEVGSLWECTREQVME